MGGGVSNAIDDHPIPPPSAPFSFDYEHSVLEIMARERESETPQSNNSNSGIDINSDQQPLHSNRKRGVQWHKEHESKKRVRELIGAEDANTSVIEENDLARSSSLPLLPLKRCPPFSYKGISIRVLRHFAYEVRRQQLLVHQESGRAPSILPSSIAISQVWNQLVRPIVEPLGFTSLVELTDDVLFDAPTGLSVMQDVGAATHFVVVNHDEKFLDLVDALCKRYGEKAKGEDEVYFWIDQFSMPLGLSERFPQQWFLTELTKNGLSKINNIVVVLLSNDGFTSTTDPVWRKNSLLTKIECLVPLGIAFALKRSALEILMDDDDENAMRRALLLDVEKTLSSFDNIKSICLDDDFSRTKYFHTAGFFKLDVNGAVKERHEAVDCAVRSLMRGWLFIEAKAILIEQLQFLNVDIAKSHVGKVDLNAVYKYCSSMASLLWETKTLSGMSRAVDIVGQVLKSSQESQGSLSEISVSAATTLKTWLLVQEKFDEVEPLLLQMLARAKMTLSSTSAVTSDDSNAARGGVALTNAKTVAMELGSVFVHQHRDEEALPFLRDGFGPGADVTLECLERQAQKLHNQGKKKEARKLFGQIIRDCNEATAQHPTVLRAVSVIANFLLDDQGDRTQSLTLFRKVCAGYLAIHGELHFQTVLSYRRVAMLLWENRNFEEMAQYIKIADGILPKDVVTLIENAEWFKIRGDYCYKVNKNSEAALLFFSRALAECDKANEGKSTLALSLVASLGALEQESVHLDNAKSLYKRYLMNLSHTNQSTSEALRVTVDLAWTYTSLGQHSYAEPLFRKHFVELSRLHGDTHPLVNRCRARLADCLESQGRRDEAIQLQHSNASQGYFQQSQVLLGVIQ